jgi:flagellar biosynthesis protein FliR
VTALGALVVPHLVLALRGAAAIAVLTTLAGGLPRLVQLGLAAAAGLWTSLLVAPRPAPLAGGLALIAARELAIGATLGLVAAVPLIAAATAGRLVDAAGHARGAYGGLFAILAAAVFVGIDGHVAVIAAIGDSFRAVPAIDLAQPGARAAIAALVGAAVRLAIPWLVTAAVVEIAVGVGVRVAGRAALHAPIGAAAPAALVMMTATLISLLAVGVAALIR